MIPKFAIAFLFSLVCGVIVSLFVEAINERNRLKEQQKRELEKNLKAQQALAKKSNIAVKEPNPWSQCNNEFNQK